MTIITIKIAFLDSIATGKPGLSTVTIMIMIAFMSVICVSAIDLCTTCDFTCLRVDMTYSNDRREMDSWWRQVIF